MQTRFSKMHAQLMPMLHLHQDHLQPHFFLQKEDIGNSNSCGLQLKKLCVCCQKGGKPGSYCGTEGQYVGLTKRKAKNRWGEHRTYARPRIQSTSKHVGFHFSSKGHTVHDMSFVVIEEVKNKKPFFAMAVKL